MTIRRYRCRSSIAQFLSPQVSKLRWIEATISELRLEVEDGHEPSVQCWKLPEAAALRLIQPTGEYLRGFALLCGIQSFINLFVLDVATKLR
jgi:hypothetical protein